MIVLAMVFSVMIASYGVVSPEVGDKVGKWSIYRISTEEVFYLLV